MTKYCKKCINTTNMPFIEINDEGLCNVCELYKNKFDATYIKKEMEYIKNFISSDSIVNCMVAVSGGKDSTAMLNGVKKTGFNPLAFTFNLGYNSVDENIIKYICSYANVSHEVIDIHKYISEIDRRNFYLMGDVYEKVLTGKICKENFAELYSKGRKYYSTKFEKEFAFVRPCQICRKVVIKAYYEEALLHNVRVIFVGINEWASIRDGKLSAIRVLKPYENRPAVLIVHWPFLIQTKYEDVLKILKQGGFEKIPIDLDVETGGNNCILANACERISHNFFGFHLDALRLSREVTVGFIDKATAAKALGNDKKEYNESVMDVLIKAGVI